MQRFESTNWSPTPWINAANELATDLEANLQNPDLRVSLHLLDRCTKIMSAAFKSHLIDHGTAQENQAAAKETYEFLRRIKKIDSTLNSNTTSSLTLQENFMNAISKTEELSRAFHSSIVSSLPQTTTSITATIPIPPIATTTIPTPTATTTTRITTKTTTTSHGKGKKRIKTKKLQAALDWDETSIRDLVNKNAHVDSKKKSGLTPLAYAIKENNLNLVKLLFQAHANPNQMLNAKPLIFYALEKGNEEIALTVLQAGANKTAENRNNESVLIAAIKYGAENVVSFLSEDQKVLSKAKANPNPLLIAVIESGNESLLEWLLDQGIRPNPLPHLVQPLNEAVKSQNIHAVKLLLELGGDPNQIDVNKRYPLFLAGKSGNIQIFNLLMEAGADFSKLLEKDPPNSCPLELFFNTGSLKYDDISANLKKKDKKQAVIYEEQLRTSVLLQACQLFSHPATIIPRKYSLSSRNLLSLREPISFTPTESALFWAKEIMQDIELINTRAVNVISPNSMQKIKTALDQPNSMEDTAEKIKSGKSVCLHSGYVAAASKGLAKQFYSTTLTFCEGFMCISDRFDKKSPIQIIRIDPKKIHSAILKELVTCRDKNNYDYLIKKIIKDLATDNPGFAEKTLVDSFPLGDQIGRGALENVETSLWFLIAMSNPIINKMLKGDLETTNEKGVVHKIQWINIVDEIQRINKDIKSLLFFNQIRQLEKYIGTDSDRRKKFAADKNLIKKVLKPMKALAESKEIDLSLQVRIFELMEKWYQESETKGHSLW
jgi:ankyrin repeat protein